jgi:hypothetical protein
MNKKFLKQLPTIFDQVEVLEKGFYVKDPFVIFGVPQLILNLNGVELIMVNSTISIFAEGNYFDFYTLANLTEPVHSI